MTPIIEKRDDVPEFTQIFSAPQNAMADAFRYIPNYQEKVAVLELTEGECAVVVCSDLKDTESYYSVAAVAIKAVSAAKMRIARILFAAPNVMAAIKQGGASDLAVDEDDKTEIMEEFDDLLVRAIDAGAQDIHITDRALTARVEFRVFTRLEHAFDWAGNKGRILANAIFQVAGDAKETNYSNRQMANTNMSRTVMLKNGKRETVRLRFQQAPIAPADFYLNCRILRAMDFSGDTIPSALERLGYLPEQVADVNYIIHQPQGAIITGGETGSGKSTFEACVMECLYRDSGEALNLIVAADPPEYDIPGVRMIPISSSDSEGVSFDDAFAGMMRQDPDIIGPGEIRNESSLHAVVNAALSGHRVMATIHAGSATGIIRRLEVTGGKLGASNPVDRETLGSDLFLAGLVHQSLVPIICDTCAIDWEDASERMEIDEAVVQWVKAHKGPGDHPRVEKPGGCDTCTGRGRTGVTVVSEVVCPDETYLALIRQKKDKEAELHWVSAGGMTAAMVAKRKIMMGIISPIDAFEKIRGMAELPTEQAKAAA